MRFLHALLWDVTRQRLYRNEHCLLQVASPMVMIGLAQDMVFVRPVRCRLGSRRDDFAKPVAMDEEESVRFGRRFAGG